MFIASIWLPVELGDRDAYPPHAGEQSPGEVMNAAVYEVIPVAALAAIKSGVGQLERSA